MLKYVQNSGLVQTVSIFADVLFVIGHQLPLDFERAFKRALFYELTDHRRHSAQDTVVQKQGAANGQLHLVEGLQGPHMFQHLLDEGLVIALSPKKLLEVHGVHFVVRLIAHAVAFDFPVVDAQHGTAADHVKPAVQLEKFQGSRDVRKLLQFVEKQQGFPRKKALGRVEPGDILDDVLGFVPVGSDHFIVWFFHKVDVDHALVVHLGKAIDGLGFSDLPGALYDQGLSVWVCFPGV